MTTPNIFKVTIRWNFYLQIGPSASTCLMSANLPKAIVWQSFRATKKKQTNLRNEKVTRRTASTRNEALEYWKRCSQRLLNKSPENGFDFENSFNCAVFIHPSVLFNVSNERNLRRTNYRASSMQQLTVLSFALFSLMLTTRHSVCASVVCRSIAFVCGSYLGDEYSYVGRMLSGLWVCVCVCISSWMVVFSTLTKCIPNVNTKV